MSVKEFSRDLVNVGQQIRREGLMSMLPNHNSGGSCTLDSLQHCSHVAIEQ